MEHKLAPIKREHIEEAAKIIDKETMPPSYVGEYMVEVNGKTYHFKYITRLAYKLATGKVVDPNFFQSNQNYRQKIIDLGFPVITQNQNIMIKNPFLLSDEKLGVLLKAYSEWLIKHPDEQSYSNRIKKDSDQIRKTFLNPAFLDEVKNAQFKQEIKAYISKLDGPVGIRLGDQRITDNLTRLKNNFRYIITTQDDPFLVANSLLAGKKQIKHFSKSFWSPVLQARYPDIIPNWNNKTENLLKVLGVNVKTSKINTVEKLQKISEAFQYLHQLDPKLDFFHLNHLMHYGFVIEEGKMLIDKLLDNSAVIETTLVPLLKIYEIKRNAPERNYPMLLDKENQSFFWNQQKFANNQPGDMVFVVSRPNKEALFVTLSRKGIETKYDKTNNSSSFVYNGKTYRCEGEWDSFTHFRINQVADVPADWNWSRIIGQAETYNLWNPTIDKIPERLQKIDDLLKLFPNGEAYDKLVEYKAILAGNKPEEETVNGLLAGDSGDWPEESIEALKGQNHITIWWDKKPSGGEVVLKQLKSKIKKDQFFYFYISDNNKAKYKIKIVDYALEDDYATKRWNLNDDVAEFSEHFHEYVSVTKSGKERKAQIIFLADEIVKLDIPIPVDRFVFYEGFQAPTQNNIQPFVEIKAGPPTFPPAPNPDKKKKIHFTDEDRDILMAIKTKPFILLAGLSGTGKSRLVRKLAFESCAKPELRKDERKPGNFELVTVRPNWHDSTELVGYITRISGQPKYVATSFLRFLVKAWEHLDVPFFLCLDEMNLAPVEQYFAEYLSVIETRDLKTNTIVTDSIITCEQTDNREVFTKLLEELDVSPGGSLWQQFVDQGISIPPNLIVMGTVNMDETTHSFSRKVLDRAMTIEMNKVNLREGLEEVNIAWRYPEIYIDHECLLSKFTNGGQVNKPLGKTATIVLNYLEALNEVLDKTAFKIAYRVRDEFLIYCYHNSELSNKPIEWDKICLDEMTFMKVLSRIEGDEARTRDVLISLNRKVAELLGENCNKSVDKVNEMIQRLDLNGYTSFWA